MAILLAFAFLSGVVTVLSPCILPILPIVLSSSAGGKARPLAIVAGLVITFSLATLALSRLVGALGLSANTVRLAAVVVIVLMGLTMLLPALSQRLEAVLSRLTARAPQPDSAGSGWGQGLLTGMSLGVLWVPCAGPILAAVIVLAATQGITAGAVAVVVAYALGASLPLLAIAYGSQAVVARLRPLASRPLRVQQSFGLVMILTALLIAFNGDRAVMAWAVDLLPEEWSSHLTAFERAPLVEQQLDALGAEAGSAPDEQAAEAPEAPMPATTTAAPPTAPAPTATPVPSPTPLVALDTLGPAPELVGINNWINSEPLTLEALRGKVVLVEFWTLGCINCQRTLPYVTSWYDRYEAEGLVVIGVHTPEFAYEHESANVERAVEEWGIRYPVAQDNDFKTWRAYSNRYWPAQYFIDAKGDIRHLHIGEGGYEESELVIQQLLAEARAMSAAP